MMQDNEQNRKSRSGISVVPISWLKKKWRAVKLTGEEFKANEEMVSDNR